MTRSNTHTLPDLLLSARRPVEHAQVPAGQSLYHMHALLYVDICVDICVGMHVHACVGMCVDICVDMCVGMHVDMWVDMRVGMRVDMRVDIPVLVRVALLHRTARPRRHGPKCVLTTSRVLGKSSISHLATCVRIGKSEGSRGMHAACTCGRFRVFSYAGLRTPVGLGQNASGTHVNRSGGPSISPFGDFCPFRKFANHH